MGIETPVPKPTETIELPETHETPEPIEHIELPEPSASEQTLIQRLEAHVEKIEKDKGVLEKAIAVLTSSGSNNT